MDLNTTQQILLSILAAALAVFLILSIVIAVLVIRLLKTLRIIADKAESVIESAEAVGEVFKKAAAPLGIFRFLQGIADTVSRKDRDNKEG